jgi:peptide/nickel transport system ATP-binding protein
MQTAFPPAESPMSDRALLEVRGLRTYFSTQRGLVRALDGVDLTVDSGEAVGVVGESGSGKTLTAYSVLGLLPQSARIVDGSILFQGRELRGGDAETMRRLRGSGISMVFQEPLTALNPVFPVGTQISDVLRAHGAVPSKQLRGRVAELLHHVGIPAPDHVAAAYPFQLSGGMRQRVLIAMAIACSPRLLIADEPTTALDATVQAQILDLLRHLVKEDGISLILITHNFGIVADLCERIYVMYAGQVVEHGSVRSIFATPRHPYTAALLHCIPVPRDDSSPLETIEGSVPSLVDPPVGCRFAARCPHAQSRCLTEGPLLRRVADAHWAACHYAETLGLTGVPTYDAPTSASAGD